MDMQYSPPKLKPVSAGQNYLSPSALREARTIQDGHLLMDSKGSVMRVFEGAYVSSTRLLVQGTVHNYCRVQFLSDSM